MLAPLLDRLAFSSVWVAAAAGTLCAAASLAMGIAPALPVLGVAMAGTLVVYNVDRLRDLPRDQQTSPLRSAFVARNQRGLSLLTAAALVASLGFGAVLGPRALLVLVPVLALGLLHRRLKRIAYLKSCYIATAWLAVVAWLPAAHAGAALHVGWVSAVLGASLLANAIASSLRDAEAAVERHGPRTVLWSARAVALAGVAAACVAPPAARALLGVPLATLATLLPFRPDERYGLWVVDGALLLGASVAIVWLAG